MTTPLHGCDVSDYQGANWRPYGGDDFAFIKATEGHTVVNKCLAQQAETCWDLGLVTGYYHFFWPGDVAAQVEWFLRYVPDDEPCMLVCDWETTNGGVAKDSEKSDFMRQVKAGRPDCRVGLYVNCSTWGSSNHDRGDFLWIAQPDVNIPCVGDYEFWQYTWTPLDQNWGAFSSRTQLADWVLAAGGPQDGQQVAGGLFGMTEGIYQRRTTDYLVS